MASTALTASNLTLNIAEEIHVKAPLDTTFAALLEQIGPANCSMDGTPMPLQLEAWPGGRWYRDLGDGNGHFWAVVQAIKRPGLLEFCGPLMMSHAVINNVQYRLTEVEGGTLIKFQHQALGFIPDNFRQGVTKGWGSIHARVKAAAEKKGKG